MYTQYPKLPRTCCTVNVKSYPPFRPFYLYIYIYIYIFLGGLRVYLFTTYLRHYFHPVLLDPPILHVHIPNLGNIQYPVTESFESTVPPPRISRQCIRDNNPMEIITYWCALKNNIFFAQIFPFLGFHACTA